MEAAFLPEDKCQSHAIINFSIQGLVECTKEETKPSPHKVENLMGNFL